jgi:hypothetical protein
VEILHISLYFNPLRTGIIHNKSALIWSQLRLPGQKYFHPWLHVPGKHVGLLPKYDKN